MSALGQVADEFLRAALDGNEDEIKRLLAAGGDINSDNRTGTTALVLAVFVGDVGAVELLLRYGANPNWPQNDEVTSVPLWHAENDFGLHEIAAVLRRYGAR